MDDQEAGALAFQRDVDTRAAALQQTEAQLRTVFDCSGTVWATHRRADGKSVCHGMPWTGAPDVLACGVRIESITAPGVYEIVPPDGKFSPEEISEAFLYRLGGGRTYRVSLRFKGDTVRNSYLRFELEGMGDRHAMPHEAERDAAAKAERDAAAKAARAAAPAASSAPSPGAAESAAVLAFGADPVASMFGSAVTGLTDPGLKLAFALALDRGVRAEALRQEQMQRDERLFTFMGGLVAAAAKGNGGGGDALSIMREQNSEMRRLRDAAEANAAAEAKRARDLELAAARGSTPAPAAPNPFLVAVAQGVANGLPGVMTRAVEMAGPEAARAVVSAGAQMAGAVAG